MSTVVVLATSSEIATVLTASYPESAGHEILTLTDAFDSPLHDTLRLIREHDADAVVIEPGVRIAEGVGMAGAIEDDQPDLSIVLVAEPNPQLLSQAMRVGVREVVPPLSINQDLVPAVRRAADLVSRRRAAVVADAPTADTSRVIAVISPKGGAGKTVLATNLAVGLAQRDVGKVVLFDADLQFGDVNTALRVQPESTIADAVRAGLSDVTALKLHLAPHPSGLFVMSAPERPGEADEVSSADLGKAIDLLAEEFPYLVVDTDGGLGERTLTVLEHATDVIFVCATDVPSVRGLAKAIEALDLIGMTSARRHFVLNRADARVGLDNDDIALTLKVAFDVHLPSSREVPFSINEGTPILGREQPTSVTKPLQQLVDRFVVAKSEAPTKRGLFGRRD